ncbi:MAG TPA: hypothetical protein VGJ23_06080 [Gaiellaceae bacterium]
MRLSAVAVASAVAWTVPSATVIPTRSWIGAGPILAGSHVVWASTSPSVAFYVSGPARRVWRATRVPVPADARDDPSYDVRVAQRVSSVSSSALRTVFVRSIDLQLIPRCASEDPPCLAPIRLKAWRGEVWTGPPTGPFRLLAGGKGKPIALDADVDGRAILYSDTVPAQSSRVVLVRRGAPPIVLASSRDVDFPSIALAGRYAAWIERRTIEHWPAPPRTLVVYDIAARRVAYTLGVEELGHALLIAFDLQRNGTVALASDPSPGPGCDGGVAWASIAEPHPHYLTGNAIPWRIKIAAGRIAFITRSCGAPTPFRLVLETREGRILSDSVIVYGGFDFDGRRLAYLTEPKEIAVVPAR